MTLKVTQGHWDFHYWIGHTSVLISNLYISILHHLRDINVKTAVLATVCKTVRPMLSDRCPVCPVMSETLMYGGKTVGWIKLKLGTQVGSALATLC